MALSNNRDISKVFDMHCIHMIKSKLLDNYVCVSADSKSRKVVETLKIFCDYFQQFLRLFTANENKQLASVRHF